MLVISKNVKKRKSKNQKAKFLEQFSAYVTQPALEWTECEQTCLEISATMEECLNFKDVHKFVERCPTFSQWRTYIGASLLSYKHFGPLVGVTWFHSVESLTFICNEVLYPLLQQTNSSHIVTLDVRFGFSEACMQEYGVPVLCQQDALFKRASFCNMTKIKEMRHEMVRTKILYIDMRNNITIDHMSSVLKNMLAVVFAGPMCLLPYLKLVNEKLVETHQFERVIYQTFGVSCDRVAFDSDLACTCVIVYYRSNVLSCLPTHSILTNPTNALRHHYIRHALAGNIPDYWKYVLSKIPLVTFFKMRPPPTKKCAFDQMLVDTFSHSCTGSMEQQQDELCCF